MSNTTPPHPDPPYDYSSPAAYLKSLIAGQDRQQTDPAYYAASGPPDSPVERPDYDRNEDRNRIFQLQTAQIRLQAAQLLHELWTPPDFCLGCYIEGCHLLTQWILHGTRAPNHQEPDPHNTPHPQ